MHSLRPQETTYLALGAKICGPPALDRAFKTIDFLTLMDLREVSLRWGGFGKAVR